MPRAEGIKPHLTEQFVAKPDERTVLANPRESSWRAHSAKSDIQQSSFSWSRISTINTRLRQMALTVTPLNNVGVEVSGFDINKPFSPELEAELKSLWYEPLAKGALRGGFFAAGGKGGGCGRPFLA